MMRWLRNQFRAWVRWLRQLWTDMIQGTRQSMRSFVWTTRTSLRGLRHSAAVGAENVRDLPVAARLTVLRGIGLVSFVRAHPALRRLALSLPALAAGGAFITGLSLYHQIDRSAFLTGYRAGAEQALQNHDWPAARLRYRRLAADTGNAPAEVYALAQSLDGLGQKDRAEDLYEQLAPAGPGGYAPAHLRKANMLLAHTPATSADQIVAFNHLLRAVNSEPDSDEANALLGGFYFLYGDFVSAQKYLLRAEPKRPELSLLLARTNLALRDDAAARRWGERAATVFSHRTELNPADAAARQVWAEALIVLGRFPDAISTLRQGLARAENPTFRQLMATAYAGWYDSQKDDPKAADQRLTLLQEGLQQSPGSPLLLERLADAANGTGSSAKSAHDALDQRLQDPTTAATVYLSLAIEAQKKGESGKARELLERAYGIDPKSPAIANNLAWLLATAPQPDLNRALTLIESALKLAPGVPTYRDTRGQILVKLGRNPEAIDDLEYALRLLPSNRETHLALAQAYRALGMTSLATTHQQNADKFPHPPGA